MKRKTTEQFIKDCVKTHGDRYDYSLINYLNNKTKIKIICKEHGVFEQRADSHLKKGCSLCSYDKLKLSFNDFVEKANKKHINKFSYNQKNFTNMSTLMKIECPFHGLFEQTPQNHLYRGCKKCKNEKIGNIKRKNKEILIEELNEKHQYKYDYSLVNYVNNKTKIKIICPTHGIFKQRPDDHLSGVGCPFCNESIGEKLITRFLKNININFINEKYFDGCKYLRKLPFDFYLPEHNTVIEFDGIQHFKPIEFFGGKESLRLQKIKDKIKTDYCKMNNINLIRIKYNENIEEKLKTISSL